jgi:hypothetical protein
MPADTIRERLMEICQELEEGEGMHMDVAHMAEEGVKAAMACVDSFHLKLGLMHLQRAHQMPGECEPLAHVGATLSTLAEELSKYISKKDCRPLRQHLHIEEEAELSVALSARDEVAILDALADKLYVILGTASILDLPLGEAFVAVHQSNMSKEKQPDDPLAERVRDKGPNYKAPDLAKVLSDYRKKQLRPHYFMPGDFVRINSDCVNCGMSVADCLKQLDKYGRVNCKGGAAAKLSPSRSTS